LSKGPVAVILAIIIIGSVAGYLFYTNYVQGTMTLTITDPAQAPYGNSQPYDPSITHINVAFSQFEVHLAGQGNSSGWRPITISGTIDMMNVLNVSKVLGKVTLPSGKYDALRFNVTSVKVSFSSGSTLAYTIPSGSLNVPVVNGGFQITATSSVTVQLTLSFSSKEILAMNGYLTPVATAKVVS
jgi:Domain of unknown function (DUF4382)